MGRVFSAPVQQMIVSEATSHFDCHPNLDNVRDRHKRSKARIRIAKISARFFKLLESDQPPKTKEEAVQMMTPVLLWLLSFVFQQFAIRVIEWLWDRTSTSSQKQTVTVKF